MLSESYLTYASRVVLRVVREGTDCQANSGGHSPKIESVFNPLAPEFSFKFERNLYIKCE